MWLPHRLAACTDAARRAYLQAAIGQVLRAQREGVDVGGYFAWSLTDNFEWAEGYGPRFGLIHVNYETQERIMKDSGRWYQQFLGGAAVTAEGTRMQCKISG